MESGESTNFTEGGGMGAAIASEEISSLILIQSWGKFLDAVSYPA